MKKRNTKGQMKIQQMAFVLVALVIFFSLVVLIYMRIRISSLEESAKSLGDQDAMLVVAKMAESPEFEWTGSCPSCVDIDKVWALKERDDYADFWNLDYLQVSYLDQSKTGECTSGTYENSNCKTITLISRGNPGTTYDAYVALCRNEGMGESSHVKCELGKIRAAGKDISSIKK